MSTTVQQLVPGRDPLREAGVSRLVVMAPNWLGDAVMALPALADVQRASPAVTVVVAARPPVAPLFGLVRGLAGVIVLGAAGAAAAADRERLRQGRFDAALLFPNSFNTALTVRGAGIRERWGYAADWRSPLLTRRVARPGAGHQAAYYQRLTSGLGFAPGPLVPELELTSEQRELGAQFMRDAGSDGRSPYVVIAAGAAYGGAKKWPAVSFAAAATELAAEGIVPVLIGSSADAAASREVAAALPPEVPVIDATGRTDLPMLASVLAGSRGLITNDSGAMHLAAALGVPVTAIFGPTDETATHPLGRAPHTVLTHSIWCRPCMLRECPLSHGCMRGVRPEAVAGAAAQLMAAPLRPAAGCQ